MKTVLVGGEKASEKHIAKLRHTYPYIKVINGYGPTENTTFSLTYTITNTKIDGPIPIGRPLNNRKAYIMDTQGSLLSINVPGEIYVGGAGLARGYLNCAELTAEKFVHNLFCEEAEARMYKTGDLGRWLSDGNIEYLGRIDDQVKIHGYRIEPGEIESVLQEYKGVRQAAVQAREDKSGNKQLVGYIVPEGVFTGTCL